MAKRLEGVLSEYSISREDIYNQLTNAKNSVAGFTFKEMIFKDMKLIEPFNNFNVIVSSISGQLVSELIASEQHDQLLDDLKEISNENNYSIIVIMGITSQNLNNLKRDLAIFSSNDYLLKKVICLKFLILKKYLY